MGQPLKEIFFTPGFISRLAKTIAMFYPGFDTEKFYECIYDESWPSLELKAKMHHTAECIHKTLPDSYPRALDILKKIAPTIEGFEGMLIPEFVAKYGMEHWDLSLEALRYFTRFASAEFAIRPFLVENPEKAMSFMLECADDEHENVRRFASEGCRPRLPWAMAISKFKKDPAPIFPILEKLKTDPSEFVRRSVANNLNDISKDHPDQILNLCEKWVGKTQHTDRIIKHALRSLLKSGHPGALALFGFGRLTKTYVENLKIDHSRLKIGDETMFSFNLKVGIDQPANIRLEYAIDYMKANGKHSRKIFQIIEKTYKKGTYTIKRKLSFNDMTTRKHYPGEHKLTLIVNGEEKAVKVFSLVR